MSLILDLFGCSASRRNKGISFFKVPLPNNVVNKKWGAELINVLPKDRKVDASMKKRIETRKLFTRRFATHFEIRKSNSSGTRQIILNEFHWLKEITDKILITRLA